MKTLTVPEMHQKKIALSTLRMSRVGAHIIGGMDHEEAVRVLRDMGFNDTVLRNKLRGYGHLPHDIDNMLGHS